MLRKLVLKLQARPQRIHQTTMLRFHASIEFEDKVLMRQTADRNIVSHGPLPSPAPNVALRPGFRCEGLCSNMSSTGDVRFNRLERSLLVGPGGRRRSVGRDQLRLS